MPYPLSPEEVTRREDLQRRLTREELIEHIVVHHLRAYNNNPRSWKNGTGLAELYAIPTLRHS